MKDQQSNLVTIYTDGSCLGNPGKGGWAAVLRYNEHKKIISGSSKHTTNQEMELTAILKALEAIKVNNATLHIHTDSQYAVNGMSNWMHRWKQNNWMTASKKPVMHQAIWEALYDYWHKFNIQVHHVRAHVGIPENEEVDALAYEQARKV